ncbi:hypothetical protein J6590_045418 [Homalodisca vitripennis]|nr:hypothetical protein J6590_045418 [Homalodisca vitripennis]
MSIAVSYNRTEAQLAILTPIPVYTQAHTQTSFFNNFTGARAGLSEGTVLTDGWHGDRT